MDMPGSPASTPPAAMSASGLPKPAPGGGGGAPVGSPMTTPEPMEGLKTAARVQVTLAIDILQRSLPDLGVESEEGQAVLKTLNTLSKAFGKTEQKSRDLIPAEIMQLLGALPQTAPGPSAKAMSASPMIPGAGPGPMPPQA